MADEPVVATPPTPAEPGSVAAAQEALKTSDVKPELKPAAETPPAKPAEKAVEKPPVEAKPSIDIKTLKLPEGYSADQAQLTSVAEILTDEKIAPQDRAQRLVDLHTKSLQSVTDNITKFWNDTNKEWTTSIATDKDIGSGDEKSPLKPEVKAAVSKLIDEYGGKELRDALDMTGAGNNPAIVKAFAKMSKLLTEGKHVTGSPAGNRPRDAAHAMFPDLA